MQKEWEQEPDYVQFDHAGLQCLIIRHPEMKHLCGYVLLPLNHELYSIKGLKDAKIQDLDVHGGITFNGSLPEGRAVGFDCAHAWDTIPEMNQGRPLVWQETYKNIAFVTNELKHLAEQLCLMLPVEGEPQKIHYEVQN